MSGEAETTDVKTAEETSDPAEPAAPAEPDAKKLKTWQDDVLEVDSDDEGKGQQTSTVKALTKHARGQAFLKEAPAEADTLDRYMCDLKKKAPSDKDDGLGVMDSSRVKSITLEEIQALMKTTETSKEAPETEQEGGSSSSAAPAQAAEKPQDPDDDEDFHAAFIAEMKKLRGDAGAAAASSKDFEAAKKWMGARAGFVFKRGRRGLGYYRDYGPFGKVKEAEKTDVSNVPDFRRSRKAKRGFDEDDEGEAEDEAEDQEAEDLEEQLEPTGELVEPKEQTEPKAEKVVESKKEKRRKRKEAKQADAKAKAAVAKQRAKEGFGEGEGELMESDPDRSEQSSEEQPESYFDLVKRFTTKKTLPEVNHNLIQYKPFRKNLYIQVKEITNMKDHEVDDLRRTHGDITVRGKRCPHPVKSFLQCGLPEKILKILEKKDIETPFPIQMQAMPALMCGRDVIGVAQTGSGKTIAFLLPLIRHIMDQPPLANGDGPIGFCVAPTRELALQIQREASVFCKAVNLTSVCAYGGGPMGEQLSALKKGAELLVGTPGRLIDVLTTSGGKISNLRRVTFMVLDEADRMFDMGFEPQIGMFLQSTRPDKQVAMFSATLPAHVEALARKVLKKPIEISVGERNSVASNVTQFVEVLDETQKFYRLLQLLGEWHEHGAIMIFVHQQKDVDEMFTELLKYGYPPLALHGGQDQQDRDFTLQDFKDGISNILISTSVAARGIDVKNCILVVNFKVPDHLEDYIHRVGRTGRAGKAGFAYTFIQPDEGDKAQDMVDALRQCNQEVPLNLKALAEEHQTAVNTGQAKKRKRWGGFGGKCFSYENSERSRQQQDRAQAKSDLLIGELEEGEEFRDPWMEPDKPKKGKGKGKRQEPEASAPSGDPTDTVAAAAQVAAKMQAANGEVPNGAPPPPPPRPKVTMVKKSNRELQEQARLMAEETLKNLPEEVREKQLPALTEKLVTKLRKAEEDKMAEASQPLVQVPPPAPAPQEEPTKPKEEPEAKKSPAPALKAIPLVPGVLGQGLAPAQANMVTKAIESLRTAATPGAATAAAAEEKANRLMANKEGVPAGMHYDELEINDYPQVARQRASNRDPLVAIEEMTGAKLQVRGQHFASTTRMPDGAKKLYMEIIGPTSTAVAKAKNEVYKMMEALAIRTLNIPGMTRAVHGVPGRYDPATGK